MMEVMMKNGFADVYSSYKDSKIDWIGEIPNHWEIKKIKRIFFEIKKRSNPDLNCGSISFGKVIYKDDEKIPEATKRSYQVVSKGDFLVNPLNLNYDLISLRIALSEIDVVVSSGYIVLNSRIEIDKQYYKWLLHRFDVAFMKTLGSGVRQTLNFGDIGEQLLVAPLLKEQTAIANFLDRKTALIDKAIRIKERQIELLKERRQILIHKAVTRGLNPNVKMKDSGVEWIGEIPEGWEVANNRSLFQERNESGREDLPILSVSIHTAVSSEELSDEDNIRGKIRIEDKSKYKLVEVGDIAFNMMRAWQGGIGAVACNGMVSPAYIVAKPIREFDSIYLEYQYRTEIFIQQMDRASKGITDFRKRLYWNEFKNFNTVLPPSKEQKEISNFIVLMHKKTEIVLRSKELEIEKLKEYKATLINSAVTGKIKVS